MAGKGDYRHPDSFLSILLKLLLKVARLPSTPVNIDSSFKLSPRKVSAVAGRVPLPDAFQIIKNHIATFTTAVTPSSNVSVSVGLSLGPSHLSTVTRGWRLEKSRNSVRHVVILGVKEYAAGEYGLVSLSGSSQDHGYTYSAFLCAVCL